MGRQPKTVSELYECPECTAVQQIQRLLSSMKAPGHLKWLWCLNCKAATNHVKINDRRRC
jgi:hypothetical protein